MAPAGAKALADYLEGELGDDLRSVVRYDRDDHEVVYVREDIERQYSADDVRRVVRDLELESIGKELQEELYVHGDLTCTVRCFEGGVELHFVEAEGVGVAVALEPAAMVSQKTFLAECMERAGIDYPE